MKVRFVCETGMPPDAAKAKTDLDLGSLTLGAMEINHQCIDVYRYTKFEVYAVNVQVLQW